MDLLKHIPKKSTNLKVLDVGCATGANGKLLLNQKLAKEVFGIEIDVEMSKIAANIYNKVFVGNLDEDTFLDAVLSGLNEIDYILIGDVLEHLQNPIEVLQKLIKCLSSAGKVIFSVPNVQHIDVFIHVFIKGYWPLNERGIFDKTHLRWFTLKNIELFLDQINLNLIIVDRNFRFRDRLGSKFPIGGRLLRLFFKNYFTFQYIIVCNKNE